MSDDAIFRDLAGFEEQVEELVLAALELAAGQALVDLGGGDGAFSARLAARTGCGLTVVEPDPALAAQARLRPEVGGAVEQDAEHWALGQGPPADRVLLKEVSHHFVEGRKSLGTDVLAIFAGIRQRLRPGGRLVIYSRPREGLGWPMWPAAVARWEATQPDEGYLAEAMANAGFSGVKVEHRAIPMEVPTDVWCEEVRQVWSTWGDKNFAAGEIADGCATIRADNGGAATIRFEERVVLVAGATD